FYGANLSSTPVNVAAGTNACLLIGNVQSNTAGFYSVTVANSFGGVVSSNALLSVTPVCVAIDLYAGLSISGGVTGQTYRVQYVTNVTDNNWTTLTTITQKLS